MSNISENGCGVIEAWLIFDLHVAKVSMAAFNFAEQDKKKFQEAVDFLVSFSKKAWSISDQGEPGCGQIEHGCSGSGQSSVARTPSELQSTGKHKIIIIQGKEMTNPFKDFINQSL